jgi:hypothetical protein
VEIKFSHLCFHAMVMLAMNSILKEALHKTLHIARADSRTVSAARS